MDSLMTRERAVAAAHRVGRLLDLAAVNKPFFPKALASIRRAASEELVDMVAECLARESSLPGAEGRFELERTKHALTVTRQGAHSEIQIGFDGLLYITGFSVMGPRPLISGLTLNPFDQIWEGSRGEPAVLVVLAALGEHLLAQCDTRKGTTPKVPLLASAPPSAPRVNPFTKPRKFFSPG